MLHPVQTKLNFSKNLLKIGILKACQKLKLVITEMCNFAALDPNPFSGWYRNLGNHCKNKFIWLCTMWHDRYRPRTVCVTVIL